MLITSCLKLADCIIDGAGGCPEGKRSGPHKLHILATVLIISLTILFAALASESRHGPLVPIIQMVLGGAVLAAPLLGAVVQRRRKPLGVYRRMLETPFFYCWLGLMALLLIQWANAGRELVLMADDTWEYALPHWPTLPSAFDKNDATQVLSWFIPAGAIGAVLSAGRRTRDETTNALKWIVTPAGILGWCGLIQWLIADGVRVLKPSEGFFVSGFGYANHAGAFFVLMLAASLGLLCRSLLSNGNAGTSAHTLTDAWRQERHTALLQRREVILYGVVALGCLVGAHVSMSRAAITMSWFVTIGTAALTLRYFWPRLSRLRRLQVTALTAVAMLSAFFLVHGAMHTDLNKELATLWGNKQQGSLHRVLNDALMGNRPLLRQASVMILKDAPLFGAGAWSLPYLAPLKLNSGYEPMLGVGTASAHCDPLQFLSEFGIIGTGCLAGMFISLFMTAKGTFSHGSSLRFCSVLGLAVLLLYCCIDLPFRHPAILCTWFAIAAVLASRAVVGEAVKR